MSATVEYKGETLTTVNDTTKTLLTEGKYLEDDITITDTPAIPTLQSKSKTYTPTTSQQAETITYDNNYDGLSSVSITVNAMTAGTAGTPTATKGTVSNHAVSVTPSVTNTTGYISGGTKTGTAVSVSASELVSGTYSVTSSGTKDVTNYASASIAAGTEGTPSATKGTVSNNSVTVTPSVTNSAGYISGGTKTGTAVSVSASELVSGNKAIVANGTGIDVTNYSTVSVDVPSGGSSKNFQAAQSINRVTATTLSAISDLSITVAETGTYDVYWSAFRSSTSGTWSTRLYIAGTASGDEQTTWTNHIQNAHLTNVSLTKNQTVQVYGKSRGTNYYLYGGTLTIIQQ